MYMYNGVPKSTIYTIHATAVFNFPKSSAHSAFSIYIDTCGAIIQPAIYTCPRVSRAGAKSAYVNQSLAIVITIYIIHLCEYTDPFGNGEV